MAISSTSDMRSKDRAHRIRQIVSDYIRSHYAGKQISIESVAAAHPDLAPELLDELEKFIRIHGVLNEAEDMQYEQAATRIALDWQSSPSSGQYEGNNIRESGASEVGRARHTSDGSEGEDVRRTDHPIPAKIGRYRVRHKLGEGAFGTVYLAWDEELDREVAVKVSHARSFADSKRIEDFLDEARTVARLDHPSIVPVYDIGRTADGSYYVVSKWIRGTDLQLRMHQEEISEQEAVHIVATIADALHYAHERGLVHRDVKPANILLGSDGTPYLGDFGLALSDRRFGQDRSFAGTPAYMSPEQARGEAHRVDARSDVFSLGVVLYELITGNPPFQSESREGLLDQILWSDPVPLRKRRDWVPHELERICLKALSKRALDRYRTAQEFADDLNHYLEVSAAQRPFHGSGDRTCSSWTLHSFKKPAPPPRIVPKGLRPFDANDSRSFLQLVPGPRDRDGLPESIRQWKVRIETGDLEESFAVGVLYGPSGCGKSSLVRAGLLPRIPATIHTIYVEATADRTETRILKELVRRYPELASDGNLNDCLAALRCGCGPAEGSKIFLVIDQFEQWLHGRREADRRILVQALRHCDGSRLQCLLLVRDDFWLALSRFMTELEIDLDQRHNAALVDLFDPAHARKVLAEFGRAYGQLPEDLTRLTSAHETFIHRAIEDLTHEDKIVPVQLALFAEMVKAKSWNPGTLRDVGGLAGIGVTFLEETFSTQAANPQYRVHEPAARKVLEALMPENDNNMKGRIRSYPELLDLSGYGEKPRDFKELIRILDSQTRLITPTDPEVAGVEEATALPGQRFYQLTHDYLVPAIRQWLTKKRRSTRAGRSELRLASRTAMWSSHHERRQLPSFLEWISICLLTQSHDWTHAQQKMMRAATRHHALMVTLMSLIVLIFFFVGFEMTGITRNWLMQFRARYATIWIAIGNDRAVWPLLKNNPDPTHRTRVIHGLSPIVLNPQDLLDHLEEQDDVSIRRAMLLTCGELLGDSSEAPDTRAALRRNSLADTAIQRLIDLYRNDPDPGIHAAAGWVLQRCPKGNLIDSMAHHRRELQSSGLHGDRQWYINGQDHTMIIVPGPTQFLMGAADGAASDLAGQKPHNQRIRRSFSIASMETTVEQFQKFLADHPSTNYDPGLRTDGKTNGPQTSVTWYEAAAYCNWLSESEGLPAEERCYLPNDQGSYAAGMQLAPDYLERRGYRLPTEAEWEYACRAGATTAYAFGTDVSYLEHYGIFQSISDGFPRSVGTKKPNDLGLFDMHGNVSEWCQECYTPYSRDRNGSSANSTDFERPVQDSDSRIVRGGSFLDRPAALVCMARDKENPGNRKRQIGFRVVRSYP